VFEQLLARLAQALDRAKLAYMVIGGQAVQLYGEPRLTRDIDITLAADADGLPVVSRLCAETGLKPLVADPAAFVKETMVLPALDEPSGIRVDFIFSRSPYERQAIERSRSVQLAGAGVRFAAVEDVVVHKLVAGRPRDIEDVRGILAKNPGLDRDYTERWLADFDRALARDLLATLRRLLAELAPPA
jgi:hypothetical protein